MNWIPLKKVFKKTLRAFLLVVVVLSIISLLLDFSPLQKFLQNRFRRPVEKELSKALGRSVQGGDFDFTVISGVGFSLQGVSIGEAPGFGSEPFLYAESIHFVLSWHSLLSRHFELSRITMRQASINIVRNPQGRWNFETWFENAPERTEALPPLPGSSGSAASASSPRRDLPVSVYLDNSRINFKDLRASSEKKVFILAEVSGKIEPAWFSNAVNFDLRLKPSRTDVAMENSGEVRVSGTLGPFRTSSLWPVVIQGELKMEKFPYSDMVALLTGRLTYLHGLFQARASFEGPLNGPVRINTQINLFDLHSWRALPREKFVTAALDIPQADLRIGDSIAIPAAHLVLGSSPLKVKGKIENLTDPELDIRLEGEGLQLSDVVNLARGFTADIAPDLRIGGSAKTEARLAGSWRSPSLTVDAAITPGQIQSSYLERPLAFAPFEVSFQDQAFRWKVIHFGPPDDHFFQWSGNVSKTGSGTEWNIDAAGRKASVSDIEGLVRTLGYWPIPAHVQGLADFSLQWGRTRIGPDQPSVNGHAILSNLVVRFGTGEDFRVAMTKFEARKDLSHLVTTKMTWGHSVASASLQFHGLDFHRAQVNLNGSFLDVSELLQLGATVRDHLVSEGGPSTPSPPDGSQTTRPGFTWVGKISSTWVYFRQFQLTNFRSDYAYEEKSFRMDDCSLDAYAGKAKGRLHLEWDMNQPQLRAEGHVENAHLDSLMNVLTPLGPAVQGRASGDFVISGEKVDGQPWGRGLTAHVDGSFRDLKNVHLNVPPAVQELRDRLNLSPASLSKDLPFSLELSLDYGADKITVGEARLSRGDLLATMSGSCSRDLSLDLRGTVEKVPAKRAVPTPAVTMTLRGPLRQPELSLISSPNAH